ncbi:MAG TPA: Crp/Fnr family transcriptional regulator [Gemmatimonadaceae bacterium]
MSASQEEFPRPLRRASRAPFDIRSSRESAEDQSSERNLLLSLLPESAYASLAPHLEPMAVTARQVAWRPESRIHAVYFPRSAVFSVLTPLERHSPVESATVGHEGIIGVPVILGVRASHSIAVVQVDGEAARVDADRFRSWLAEQDEQTQSIFLRYSYVLLEQTAQSVACNRKHALEERCARWLLATRDRVGADEFSLTHEFLAAMLGVRRASVTVALGLLQQEGYLTYSRGRLKVLDAAGLEQTSCECYRVVRAEQERIMGGTFGVAHEERT